MSSVSPSYADPPGPNALPIHVVTIKTEESDAQADALTTALKAEVRDLEGWSLGEGDFSLEILALALRCPSPPDAACEMRIADEINADRYIWGTIDVQDGKAVGALHLWRRKQGQTSVDLEYAANLTEPNDEALQKVVRDALLTLTGGPPKGSVEIKAGDVNGQLFIDGKPSGAIRDGKATIFVPSGEHRIEVRAPGYADVSGDVTVRPNGSVSLSLQPVPTEEAEGAGAGPNMRRIGAYSALVAGGAFAVGGVYSSLKVNSVNNEDAIDAYRRGVPQGEDLCDAADRGFVSTQSGAASPADVKDKCSTASKFQTLQFVFYGLSAISVGAGAYLLATEEPEEQGNTAPPAARVELLPTADHTGGGLDLRVVF
ncbi:MAG: PEGA domain-containing protein [Myxococcota bacterium]